jgi:hypothetical protein
MAEDLVLKSRREEFLKVLFARQDDAANPVKFFYVSSPTEPKEPMFVTDADQLWGVEPRSLCLADGSDEEPVHLEFQSGYAHLLQLVREGHIKEVLLHRSGRRDFVVEADDIERHRQLFERDIKLGSPR